MALLGSRSAGFQHKSECPYVNAFVKRCNIHEIACQEEGVKVFRRPFKYLGSI